MRKIREVESGVWDCWLLSGRAAEMVELLTMVASGCSTVRLKR
jgi:hypothetical protein